jgi:hypothetical protein
MLSCRICIVNTRDRQISVNNENDWGVGMYSTRIVDTAAARLRPRPVCGVGVFTLPPTALARLRSAHEYMGRLPETPQSCGHIPDCLKFGGPGRMDPRTRPKVWNPATRRLDLDRGSLFDPQTWGSPSFAGQSSRRVARLASSGSSAVRWQEAAPALAGAKWGHAQ